VQVKSFGWAVVAAGRQRKGGTITVIVTATGTVDGWTVPAGQGLAKACPVETELEGFVAVARVVLEVSFESMTNDIMRWILSSVAKQEQVAVFDSTGFVKKDEEECARLATERGDS